jgi:hypothetical protein
VKEIKIGKDLVAFCGLYCAACGSYRKGRCPGCHKNAKAKWCKVRSCCLENSFITCADCKESADPNQCRKFNNIFSKAMAFIFKSDRRAGVLKIRELGLEGFARHMAEQKRHSMPRRGT